MEILLGKWFSISKREQIGSKITRRQINMKPLDLNQELLNKVHRIQLENALEVKRICDLHQIKYFIIAGTLLGAVRHNGFIPWDDDLDIGMLRDDYERFVEICETELSNKYFLQTWHTDHGFGLPFAKLRRNSTKYIEMNSANIGGHKGVFIDIFPFDNVPSNIFSQKLQDFNLRIFKRLLLQKLGYETNIENSLLRGCLYKCIDICIITMSTNKIKICFEKHMKKYNNLKQEFIITFGGTYGYRREMIRREWIDDLTTINFEGVQFPCPRAYNEYLTHFYGDYMTFPPESERYNRHGIIEIYFGDE